MLPIALAVLALGQFDFSSPPGQKPSPPPPLFQIQLEQDVTDKDFGVLLRISFKHNGWPEPLRVDSRLFQFPRFRIVFRDRKGIRVETDADRMISDDFGYKMPKPPIEMLLIPPGCWIGTERRYSGANFVGLTAIAVLDTTDLKSEPALPKRIVSNTVRLK